MANFATLKKSSNTLERLTKELEKASGTQTTERQVDDRFWKLERDKSGNGSAVIRFLPAPAVDGDEGMPWARYWDHGFKGPTGKWYIENSLTSIGQKDPLAEFNSNLWNQTEDGNSWQRKQAREQKRRLHYVSNILVISDPKHPENEGKIFLYKFGKKIFDKIALLMNPEFEDDEAVNPFDFWKGATFKLRIRTVEGYPNYDQSSFETPKALSDDDAFLESLWNKSYSLKEFVDPNNKSMYKTYDELKQRLDFVLAEDAAYAEFTGKVAPAPKKEATPAKTAPKTAVDEDVSFDLDEDDDDLKQFKALALN